MNSLEPRCALFVVLLSVGVAAASDTPIYQEGTITASSAGLNSYDLAGSNVAYRISRCGDFQSGQKVDYRAKGDKVYISNKAGKEYKCAIEAKLEHESEGKAAPMVFLKGTIEGFETRRDLSVGGGGGGGNGMPGSPVSAMTRIAKVYRLRGPDLIYKIDYCGAFQAGQFTPGQVVEYRVDGNRLYIRHDTDKEYGCKIEGTQKPEGAGAGGSSSGATPLAVAKVSLTSTPDGADIEVDGSFCGNTPSDLEVPEGEHTINVKKAGYNNWQRKMKVVAGSNIRLLAELEKSTTP